MLLDWLKLLGRKSPRVKTSHFFYCMIILYYKEVVI